MHIVVLLKQVHEPGTPPSAMRVGADGRSLVLQAGTSFALNAYDANAIEAAMQIKDKQGGSVTAISVGDKSTVPHLRRAVAMGADRAIHVEGPTGLDCTPEVVGTLLAGAVRKAGSPVDLVLCGRQASDTDAGHVPFVLAEQLGLTPVSPVVAISAVTDAAVEVVRLADGGTQRLRVHLPALLGVSNEINKPRAPGLKGVMAAKKAEVPSWPAAELEVEVPPPALSLVSLSLAPKPDVSTEILAAASAAEAGRMLADRLKSEGFL